MLVHRKSHGPMYSHGISTLMLAEVVGMVDEPDAKNVRRALERAVLLILKSQAQDKRTSCRRMAVPGRQPGQRSERERLAGAGAAGGQRRRLRRPGRSDRGRDRLRQAVVPSGTIADSAINPATARRRRSPAWAFSLWKSAATITRPPRWGERSFCSNIRSRREPTTSTTASTTPRSACTRSAASTARRRREHTIDMLLNCSNRTAVGFPTIRPKRPSARCIRRRLSVLALAIDYRYLPIYQR